MKTIKHTVTIAKANGNLLNAYVNEVNGIVSTGSTLEEIKENMKEAIELYYSDKVESFNLKINYNLSI